METEEIKKELQETLAKIQGALNILCKSPTVLAYNKFLGIGQKLNALLVKVSKEENEKCSEETEQPETETSNENNSN